MLPLDATCNHGADAIKSHFFIPIHSGNVIAISLEGYSRTQYYASISMSTR